MAVQVAVGVAVFVGVGVSVGTGVYVGVAVFVAVGVLVGVEEGVTVFVGVKVGLVVEVGDGEAAGGTVFLGGRPAASATPSGERFSAAARGSDRKPTTRNAANDRTIIRRNVPWNFFTLPVLLVKPKFGSPREA